MATKHSLFLIEEELSNKQKVRRERERKKVREEREIDSEGERLQGRERERLWEGECSCVLKSESRSGHSLYVV
jgi:hypothetical protein